MKLAILYQFVEGPYGGGNQFLKALRAELKQQNAYAPSLTTADCVLVNANPGSLPYLLLRLLFIQKPVMIRLDGPISLIRGKDKYVDILLAEFIDLHASGLVFQSQWSKEQNKKLFDIKAPLETVIYNAPDKHIFYPKKNDFPSKKIKIIAASWSSNSRKGFDIYTYLDTHLDFSRYDMTFIGNSPIGFKNITTHAPVSSLELADILRTQDMYLTASQNDPCSNALLEALACGLPAVALAQGGHPELIQKGGKLFTGESDVIPAIDKVAKNLDHYRSLLPMYSIAAVTEQYVDFAGHLKKTSSQWLKILPSLMVYSRYYAYSFSRKP